MKQKLPSSFMKTALLSLMILVAGCDSRPVSPTNTHGQQQASSPPVPEQFPTETFLGLRDNESCKVGDSAPESAVADVTTISTVSVSDYADYQNALHGGRIKAQGIRDGYIYYAIESRRDVPFPDGSSAWVDITERYKAKIPQQNPE